MTATEVLPSHRAERAESLCRWRATGELPARVRRRAALGPRAMPNACPERDALAADDVAALGRALLDAAHETGYLPADLRLAGAAVGLGSAYGALAQAYARAHGGREMGAVRLEVFPRYPAFGAVLARTARSVEDSPMVWPGLGTDRLALHTRLQTWTLKPATRTA